ncbi:MAG: TPM domain-containing protein [Bdellovibrionales bacterium]|nr:TPM domain-containing protein [Bdellovibrionales bacterium]
MDQAGMIPSAQELRLSRALKALRGQGGTQLQILTLPTLDGLTIEQASIKIVDRWQLGDKEKDNGILLLVAKKERKIRIEVGQGLEGDLPDAWAKRIISEVMVPLFKAGHPESGILLGTVNILKRTDPQFSLEAHFKGQNFRSVHRKKKEESLLSRFFSFGFLIFMLILFVRNPMLFLFLLAGGGGRGGYRGGGFGGGGGGWSGGGGGFSGGGASGGW